jgi:hypothetical protein
LNAKVVLTKAIDTMTEALDSIGFYVVDCNMSIQSTKHYSNLEDLKSDVINNKASIIFDVDCFMGNNVWRQGITPIPEVLNPSSFLNEILSIDIGDIASYIKEKQDETFDS